MFSLKSTTSNSASSRSTIEIRVNNRGEFYITQNYSVNNTSPSRKLLDAGENLVKRLNNLPKHEKSSIVNKEGYLSIDDYRKLKNIELPVEFVESLLKELYKKL